MKYTIGTASVTYNDATITGTDTEWTKFAKIGDLFRKYESLEFYIIADVISDTEIELSTKYMQDTNTSISYEVSSGYSPIFSLYYPDVADPKWPNSLTRLLVRNVDSYIDNIRMRAKSQLIEQINNIVGVTQDNRYVKTFLIADQQGASTQFQDHSTEGNNAVLSINANLLEPDYEGLCPYICFEDTIDEEPSWSISNHRDFSVGNKLVDTPFSMVALVKPIAVSNVTIIAKWRETIVGASPSASLSPSASASPSSSVSHSASISASASPSASRSSSASTSPSHSKSASPSASASPSHSKSASLSSSKSASPSATASPSASLSASVSSSLSASKSASLSASKSASPSATGSPSSSRSSSPSASVSPSSSLSPSPSAPIVPHREYKLEFTSDSKLRFACYDESADAYVGRSYNTALATDNTAWHTYITTKSATATSAACKIYRDGLNIDDTDYESGSYVAMENLDGDLGNFVIDTHGAMINIGDYNAGVLIFIKGLALSAVQVKMIDRLLRSFAGVTI